MIQIKNIVFAQDFSPCAESALPLALDLARRTSADLHLVFVENLLGDGFGDRPVLPDHEIGIRGRLLRLGSDASRHHDDRTRLIPAVVWDTASAPGILRYAEDHEADLILMGTHGRRGFRHAMLGSVAEEVIRLASCPVLTIREKDAADATAYFRSILVPVDFTEHSREALRHAKELAWLYGAKLFVIHAVDILSRPAAYDTGVYTFYSVAVVDERLKQEIWRELRRFEYETPGPQPPEIHFEVVAGDAPHKIVQYAHWSGSDLIVMSTRGSRGLTRWLIGSVTEKVVRTAPCPVYTTRGTCTSKPAVEPVQYVSEAKT